MKPTRMAACCVSLVLLGGCTGGGGGKADDVKKVSPAEAIKIARDYAERMLALTGGTREPADREPDTAPCEGRRGELSETVSYAFFNFQVTPVPEDQQRLTLQRLREHWQQQGYTIKRDRVFPNGETGELAVENPADEYEIRVQGTDLPTALAVRISSPCYQTDKPYQPAATTTSTPR